MMRLVGVFLALAVLVGVSHSQDDDGSKPLEVPASQYFEGNDGPWSTFHLRVGLPEQYIRVLVSTASPHAIIPLSESACSSSVFETVPPDCAVSRGGLYNHNQSSTWHDLGLFGINQDGVGLEANLGYEQRAQWGLEHVGIGLQGPGFDNQTVAGIATPEPFYLGIFGLNGQPVNFTVLGNHPSPSFFTTLKEQKKIPSLSWSYTAGAKYRLKQVYGQLIFSGYDTSRFKENSVSFSMAEDLTRDLVVALQSITYTGSTSKTLLSNSIDIYIDSTDPNLWLPAEACDAFEEAFGLTLDEKSGLYLVNETHRNQLLDSNAEVSFRLSDVKAGGDTVTIVLPYAAFDLEAKNPLVDNTSYYFPLKRANSSAQYTLGRVFLQEAYLSADYERKTFNVSSCVWNQGATPNIITIPPADPNSPLNSSSSSKKLPPGTIAGIVIGSVLGFLLIAAILALFILRKRRKWIGKGFAVAARPPPTDESVLKGPVFGAGGLNGDSSSTSNNTSKAGFFFGGGRGSRRFGSRSTPGSNENGGRASSSVPFSADDVSASRSRPTTADPEHSRSGSTTTGAAAATGGALVVGPTGETLNNDGTVELDGNETAVRPDTELDGTVIQGPTLPPVVENPSGVFELPGSVVGGAGAAHDAERGRGGGAGRNVPSTVGSLVSRDGGDHSPPSPLTSTLDRNSTFAVLPPPTHRDSMMSSGGEVVSPDTPANRHGDRPF